MAKLTVEELKQNFDEWVKEMNSKICELTEVPKAMVENTDNIQHNYELITEMKSQIEELKEDIKLLKLMQLVSLKEQKLKN